VISIRVAVIPHRWAAVLLAVLGVGLLPWTLWLGLSLPSRKIAEHWDLAWAGFDFALAASLLGTATALLRRSAYLRSVAAATAALLLADAWFDVVTAKPGEELWSAIALAVVGELPLAGLCLVLTKPSE
jgi:predicted branched-subunit amino acid permease